MDKGLYIVSTNMHSKMKNMEIVANNLANINTVGYKREVPFSEFLAREENKSMKQLSNLEEGALVNTDNPLDIALSGNAYFMIKTERGIELTRDGRFSLTSDGKLVTKDGFEVLTNGNGVSFIDSLLNGEKKITVTDGGEIKVGDDVVDKFALAAINDQSLLVRTENGRFFNTAQGYQMAEEGGYKVSQGFLEESNTNPFQEIQEMISINKDYESAQKAISSIDFRLGKAREIGQM